MKRKLHSSRYPASTSVLPEIGEVVSRLCQQCNINQAVTSDIVLAVEEACTNTITHGLGKNPEQSFLLDISLGDDEVEFIIEENGLPFDPDQVPSPKINLDLNQRDIGGLGIYLMRKVMDEVLFDKSDNGLKVLRMIKRNLDCKFNEIKKESPNN